MMILHGSELGKHRNRERVCTEHRLQMQRTPVPRSHEPSHCKAVPGGIKQHVQMRDSVVPARLTLPQSVQGVWDKVPRLNNNCPWHGMACVEEHGGQHQRCC